MLFADDVELDKAALTRQRTEHLDIGSLIDVADEEARGIDPLRLQDLQLLHSDRTSRHLLPPPTGRVTGDGDSGPPLGNCDGFETLQLESFDPRPVNRRFQHATPVSRTIDARFDLVRQV